MREIPVGTSHTSSLTVTEAHTAGALGSGSLEVLGTPALVALMENAAMVAVAPFLETAIEREESSVGIALNVEHLAASGVGESVSATATVTAVNGRRMEFNLTAADSRGRTIGRGTHGRFVVEVEKFMGKIGK